MGHLLLRIFRSTMPALFIVLAIGANATTNHKLTNPYAARQVQAMLCPSHLATSGVVHRSAATLAIERLLGPQLKKLEKSIRASSPNRSNFDPQAVSGDTNSPQSLQFRSVPTWNAAPSGDPSDVYAITVADFDQKNGPDVATVQVDGTLNVLYNLGNGNFATSYTNQSG